MHLIITFKLSLHLTNFYYLYFQLLLKILHFITLIHLIIQIKVTFNYMYL